VWKRRTQVQGVSVIEEERASGKKASAPSKGKSAGDREEDKEDRGRQSGACGQTMRSAARKGKSMKEGSSTCPTIEDTGALWEKHPG